jgi:hypothetical protein
MAEPDWKALIKKHKDGIDVTNATEEDLQEYVKTKLYQYSLDRITDDNLWECFKEDFKDFNKTTFTTAKSELRALRKYLRCGGIYVEQNHQRLTVIQSLVNILEEETMREWNENDILKVGPIRAELIVGPITSVFLTLNGSGRSDSRSATSQNPRNTIPPPPQITIPPLPQNTIPPPRTAIPQHPSTSSGARIISEIAKSYAEEQKYDGFNGSFDNKLTIFYSICNRQELPQEDLMRAFPIMLKGLAQDHFFDNQLSNYTFEDACTNIRSFFEGPGYHRRNLEKWNSITLASITAENPDKSTFETVQTLFHTLRKLQYGLTPALRTKEFYHNKIVTTCQGSPACRYAVSDPPTDLIELINKLQSSITTYEKEQSLDNNAYFTDRRYHSRNQSNNRRYRGNRRYNTNRG